MCSVPLGSHLLSCEGRFCIPEKPGSDTILASGNSYTSHSLLFDDTAWSNVNMYLCVQRKLGFSDEVIIGRKQCHPGTATPTSTGSPQSPRRQRDVLNGTNWGILSISKLASKMIPKTGSVNADRGSEIDHPGMRCIVALSVEDLKGGTLLLKEGTSRLQT